MEIGGIFSGVLVDQEDAIAGLERHNRSGLRAFQGKLLLGLERSWLYGIVSALLLVLDTLRLSISLSEVDVDEDVDLVIGYWQ